MLTRETATCTRVDGSNRDEQSKLQMNAEPSGDYFALAMNYSAVANTQ